MFTGIIQARGRIAQIEKADGSARLTLDAQGLHLDDVQLGDSIAVSGPCLTVIEYDAKQFIVDVSTETLERTTLGNKRVGDAVNLEKAVRLADRLGGHLVTGHVDGIGVVTARDDLSEYVRFRVEAPLALAKYIAEKGSICVDGVSLTVNAVDGASFDLMIIPHTLSETTLGVLSANSEVNLEIDLVARYVERLAQFDDDSSSANLSLAKLKSTGFVDS